MKYVVIPIGIIIGVFVLISFLRGVYASCKLFYFGWHADYESIISTIDAKMRTAGSGSVLEMSIDNGSKVEISFERIGKTTEDCQVYLHLDMQQFDSKIKSEIICKLHDDQMEFGITGLWNA